MTHDPLCPYADRGEDEALRDVPCGICDLIAKVRDEERTTFDRSKPLPLAYVVAMEDCITVIERIQHEAEDNYSYDIDEDGYLAACGDILDSVKELLK